MTLNNYLSNQACLPPDTINLMRFYVRLHFLLSGSNSLPAFYNLDLSLDNNLMFLPKPSYTSLYRVPKWLASFLFRDLPMQFLYFHPRPDTPNQFFDLS